MCWESCQGLTLQRHPLKRAHGPNAFCAPLNRPKGPAQGGSAGLGLEDGHSPGRQPSFPTALVLLGQPCVAQHMAPVLLNQPETSCMEPELDPTCRAGQDST